MSEIDIPPSWVQCDLGDIVDYGKAEKAEPRDIPDDAWVLELEDIEKDTSRVLRRAKFRERQSKSTKNKFYPGDVLYGKLRPYLNKVVRADDFGFCSTEIIPITAPDGVDPDFLFYWLKHPAYRKYADSVSHGLSMPRLGTKAGRAAPFVLAPTYEQQRISAALDDFFSGLAVVREYLERIPGALKNLLDSVLVSAFSGEMTADWREANPDKVDAESLVKQVIEEHMAAGGFKTGNAAKPTEGVHDLDSEMFPSNWGLLTLRDIVAPDRPVTYGILKPGPELEDGVPYVRVADYPDDKLDLAGIRYTSLEIDSQFKRSKLREGDILLSIRGTVGRLVQVPADLVDANITQDTARLSIQGHLSAEYIIWYLRSEFAQFRMARAMRGVAVRGINIGDVRAIQVPIPSRAEQDEIVKRIRASLNFIERSEARYEQAAASTSKLGDAILNQAFRGELVPQDPDDESAETLLRNIREQRADSTRAKKKSKVTQRRRPKLRRRGSAMTRSRQEEDILGQPYLASILRDLGGSDQIEELFRRSDLSLADFYKQLAWEVDNRHIDDHGNRLEAK